MPLFLKTVTSVSVCKLCQQLALECIKLLKVESGVILVRHNLSIIPPVERKFKRNTLVSRVTPESLILYFFEHN